MLGLGQMIKAQYVALPSRSEPFLLLQACNVSVTFLIAIERQDAVYSSTRRASVGYRFIRGGSEARH